MLMGASELQSCAGQIDAKRIKAVLFDMGGVLISLHPNAVFEYWSQASGIASAAIAKRWYIEANYEKYETGQLDFATYCERLGKQLDLRMTGEAWLQGWNQLVGTPFEDVFVVLRKIATRLPVYCLTNSNYEHESVYMQYFAEYLCVFRSIFNSVRIGLRKPDPAVYRYVLANMHQCAESVLFLDDNAANVTAAQNCGLEALQITDPTQTCALLEAL